MDDQNPSPPSSSCTAVEKHHDHRRRRQRHVVGDEGQERGDSVACTGKSCQSCTAGVIADCVAVCCCPCAVVNLLALAFLKLPWAVARKCIGRKKRKKKAQMILDKDGKCSVGDTDGISRNKRVGEGTLGIVVEEEARDNFSSGFEAGENLYEVGHLGFGRVSFTGIAWNN